MLKLFINCYSFFPAVNNLKSHIPFLMDVQRMERGMKSRLLHACVSLLLPLLLLAGCGAGRDVSLDGVDRRFAAFYSDYLVGSGVSAQSEDVALVPPSARELELMLARHSLTGDEFQRRMKLYREQPERWKKVVTLVRKDAGKKRP